MTAVPDRTRGRMQIGKVASLTTLIVDAIRFYERHALLPKAPRTPGRFRLYSSEDVSRLAFIRPDAVPRLSVTRGAPAFGSS
jgi:hypothetical protein